VSPIINKILIQFTRSFHTLLHEYYMKSKSFQRLKHNNVKHRFV